MNHWITTTTCSYCLKNRQTCKHYILKMSASSAYQNLRRRQTNAMHQEWVSRCESLCYWMCCCRCGTGICGLVFTLEADISSTWCKDDMTYWTFYDFWDNNCQSCLCGFIHSALTCNKSAKLAAMSHHNCEDIGVQWLLLALSPLLRVLLVSPAGAFHLGDLCGLDSVIH